MSPQRSLLAQLGVLTAIAASLAAFAYFGIYESDSRTERKKDQDTRLFPTMAADEKRADAGSSAPHFTALTVFAKGDTTVLARQKDTEWRIVSPIRARADRAVVGGLLEQLQSARFKATLEENPGEEVLSKYGLKDPSFWVEARATVGGDGAAVTARLEGGIENTFDGSVYLRRRGEPAVRSAEGGVRFALQKSTLELREKQVFDVDSSAVKRLHLTSATNDWTLERVRPGTWTFTQPAPESADGAQVSAMLEAMRSERAVSFHEDDPARRRAFGLDTPALKITATLEGGETLALSASRAATDAGLAIYALREEEGLTTLAELGPGALGFERSVKELLDRTVIPFQKELATKIVFHPISGPDVVVEKTTADAGAEAWRVTAPTPGPAKIFKITSALWTLTSLKATRVVDDKPNDLERYGLGPDARFVAFHGEDGRELARLVLGSELPENKGSHYARGLRPQVVEIEGSRLGDLPWTLFDVADLPTRAATPDSGR